jgi:uncharacterized protein YkwD
VTVRGENIGSGYRTPEAVVEGWMISTLGHCEVVMHHDLIEVGVGYSEVGSQRRWTANFR